MRIATTKQLSVPMFNHGPIRARPSWSGVDLADPEVRKVLVSYVGTHLQIHPSDVGELAAHGLRIDGGRLKPIAPSAPVSETAPAAPPKKTSART